mmetsp:Transcript_6628/g.12952  ORF Transcript_6628/g.12952 Transcript_6628/m.12952 type:complete len:502 (-) Transcript_6628:893-2398(-)
MSQDTASFPGLLAMAMTPTSKIPQELLEEQEAVAERIRDLTGNIRSEEESRGLLRFNLKEKEKEARAAQQKMAESEKELHQAQLRNKLAEKAFANIKGEVSVCAHRDKECQLKIDRMKDERSDLKRSFYRILQAGGNKCHLVASLSVSPQSPPEGRRVPVIAAVPDHRDDEQLHHPSPNHCSPFQHQHQHFASPCAGCDTVDDGNGMDLDDDDNGDEDYRAGLKSQGMTLQQGSDESKNRKNQLSTEINEMPIKDALDFKTSIVEANEERRDGLMSQEMTLQQGVRESKNRIDKTKTEIAILQGVGESKVRINQLHVCLKEEEQILGKKEEALRSVAIKDGHYSASIFQAKMEIAELMILLEIARVGGYAEAELDVIARSEGVSAWHDVDNKSEREIRKSLQRLDGKLKDEAGEYDLGGRLRENPKWRDLFHKPHVKELQGDKDGEPDYKSGQGSVNLVVLKVRLADYLDIPVPAKKREEAKAKMKELKDKGEREEHDETE